MGLHRSREGDTIIISISICDDESVQPAQTEAFPRDFSAWHPDIELTTAAFPSGLRLAGGKILPVSRPLRAEMTRRRMDYNLEGGERA